MSYDDQLFISRVGPSEKIVIWIINSLTDMTLSIAPSSYCSYELPGQIQKMPKFSEGRFEIPDSQPCSLPYSNLNPSLRLLQKPITLFPHRQKDEDPVP